MLNFEYSPDHELLHEKFADETVSLIRRIQSREKRRPVILLSGGKTPSAFYKKLAEFSNDASGVDFKEISFFLGDERDVPADSTESNFKNAVDSLCAGSKILRSCIEPLNMGLSSPKDIAADYDKKLKKAMHKGDADLLILGIGIDSHTASLFPGTLGMDIEGPGRGKTGDVFISHFVPRLSAVRYTVAGNFVLSSARIVLLAIGADKKKAVEKAMAPEADFNETPASLIFKDAFNVKRSVTVYSDFETDVRPAPL
jgi:6-phosphogluconolactonase